MLDAFSRFFEVYHSSATECSILFLLPFLHEDVAIFGGSLMIVEHHLSPSLAFASIFAGMIVSDLTLYGLGTLARQNHLIGRLLHRPRIEQLGQWLGEHVATTVALARFIPGLMFPIYLGCGLYRISFKRFALTTFFTALVYLPTLLFVISRVGEAVLSHIGYWSWIVVLGLLTVAAINWVRKPNWQLLLRTSSSGARALVTRFEAVIETAELVSHKGMPALGRLRTKIALAERIPPPLFYVPLALQWFGLGIRYGSLSLPTLVNPKIEVGGLWGESKCSYLDMVGPEQRKWIADYTTLRREKAAGSGERDARRAVQAVADAGLSFPLVVKPDIGWRGFGVRLVQSPEELSDYVREYPANETILLQQEIDYEGEAGVLYARLPGSTAGKIISLTFRYFPYVIGDGQKTIRDLILTDQRAAWKAGHHFGFEPKHLGTAAGQLRAVPARGETVRLSFICSNRVGGLYRDAREHITPNLENRFDEVSKSMPEFYYGRYDIRFASLEGLRRGEDFRIIEINGAGGESINVWDPKMPFLQVYRELFAQQGLLFKIGAMNRDRGYQPSGTFAVLRNQWRQHRLINRYPPSS